jgi:hypothetical protein
MSRRGGLCRVKDPVPDLFLEGLGVPGLHNALLVGYDGFSDLRAEEFGVRLPEHVGVRSAEYPEHGGVAHHETALAIGDVDGCRRALADGVEDGVGLREFFRALGYAFLKRLVQPLQRLLGTFGFGDVDPDLQDVEGAVRFNEREVEDIVVTAVRPDPFPVVGRSRLQDVVGLAVLTGLRSREDILEAASAVRFTEPLPEEAVGEGYAIVRGEESHVYRQHLEDVVEPFPLGLHCLLGPDAFSNLSLQRFVCLSEFEGAFLHTHLEFVMRSLQFLLCLFALGNVVALRDDRGDRLLVVFVHGGGVPEDRPDSAVRSEDGDLDGLPSLSGRCLPYEFHQFFTPGFGKEDLRRPAENLARGPTRQPLEGVVELCYLETRIPDDDGGVGVPDQILQVLGRFRSFLGCFAIAYQKSILLIKHALERTGSLGGVIIGGPERFASSIAPGLGRIFD